MRILGLFAFYVPDLSHAITQRDIALRSGCPGNAPPQTPLAPSVEQLGKAPIGHGENPGSVSSTPGSPTRSWTRSLLYRSHVTYVTYPLLLETNVAVNHKSGRLVVDIDPELKLSLHAALAADGLSLKDWFVKQARYYVDERSQPHLFTAELPRPINRNK